MIKLFFDILEAVVVLLELSIFATVLMSWISPEGKGSINEILHQILIELQDSNMKKGIVMIVKKK